MMHALALLADYANGRISRERFGSLKKTFSQEHLCSVILLKINVLAKLKKIKLSFICILFCQLLAF